MIDRSKGKGREILERCGSYQLREVQTAYNGDFEPGNRGLKSENTYF